MTWSGGVSAAKTAKRTFAELTRLAVGEGPQLAPGGHGVRCKMH